MTLRRKLLLTASLKVLVLVVALYLVARAVLLDRFEELERKEALQDLRRTEKILQLDIQALREKTADYAAWDDTYAYVQKPNDAYIKSNFENSTFELLRINFVVLYDASGKR